MSLPHDSQAGLGALWRRLRPRPRGGHAPPTALSVLLRLSPWVCQGYDPLLPACLHLSVRLLFGRRHVAVTPSIGGGIWDGGRSVGVVCHFDVTGAAPIWVLDFCPDAAVHHADQVCGLQTDKNRSINESNSTLCSHTTAFHNKLTRIPCYWLCTELFNCTVWCWK